MFKSKLGHITFFGDKPAQEMCKKVNLKEVRDLFLAGLSNNLSWRLIMKYFLLSIDSRLAVVSF